MQGGGGITFVGAGEPLEEASRFRGPNAWMLSMAAAGFGRKQRSKHAAGHHAKKPRNQKGRKR